MDARLEYIHSVTGAEVTKWIATQKSRVLPRKYFYCVSNDGQDGTFITAHIGEVMELCSLREIAAGAFVIANTCIWEKASNKQVLYCMMKMNRKVELWFSKQALSIETNYELHQSTMLSDVGEFGFETSLSERTLFINRHKGFMKAVTLAFDRVSPVILPGEFGGVL